ncbi:hypothetical protein ILYODFUR_034612 [Ilyodon furcidens]|uniref:Uncharacterized protein n=1 Tax=Ilyodon furcidens TaxID=33524 RepID=A0ABV0VJI5_9TELE
MAVVEVRPVTGGLPVRTPSLFISVVESLGKTLHPPHLVMVVSGPSGTCVWQPHRCQRVNGWMTDCSVKSFGVSGDLINAIQAQVIYHKTALQQEGIQPSSFYQI